MAFWVIRAWRRAQHVGRPEESIFRPPAMLITAEIGVREIQVILDTLHWLFPDYEFEFDHYIPSPMLSRL